MGTDLLSKVAGIIIGLALIFVIRAKMVTPAY
jgi:hypothetical protein